MPVTSDPKLSRVIRSCLGILVLFGSLMTAMPVSAEDDPPVEKKSLTELLGSVLGASPQEAQDPPDLPPAKLPGSTHAQSRDIKIRSTRSGHQLQSFCLNKDGLIFAIVGPGRPYGEVIEGKKNSAEVRVHDANGKEIRKWKVDFAAQSIAVSSDGTVFVAGNGMIAKFDAEGTLLKQGETPHVAALLKDSEKMKAEAEAQLALDKQEFEDQVKQLEEQLTEQRKELKELKAKLEEVPAEERKTADKRKVRTLEMTIRNVEAQNKAQLQYYKQRGERTVDDVIQEVSGRLKIVNALTASDRDVFIASGVMKGYGYAIWRTNHEFEGADVIVTGLSGCCGQMDIRCYENGVFVAENSRKRVLQYDRDGKKLGQFGEGDRNGATGAKFGGCCNPMNLCFGSGGEVYTAESEGYIKKFTKEGSFLGIVGQARVSGGCKNVAIAVSSDGEKAYFFDLQGSRIVVLDKKAEKPNEKTKAADEEPAGEATPAEPTKKVSAR